MLKIDGSRYSGSGTIVRQSVAFSALTGRPVRIVNARARRIKPGLRLQRVSVIESIRQLVGGSAEGVQQGSREILFRPGARKSFPRRSCDIGSAGSTTALALALVPVLAFGSEPSTVEIAGGVFQDFAPSFYHLKHVMLPLLARMGIESEIEMVRPGYVPTGGGVLKLEVSPIRGSLAPLILDDPGQVQRIWGTALSSKLEHRRVSERIAEAARTVFSRFGLTADIATLDDHSSLQPGAVIAVFADLSQGARLGADRAGAPGRRSETIGKHVARQLLNDLYRAATLDRYACDQIIPFASLAQGESRFLIPATSDHVESSAWLAAEFVGAEVTIKDQLLVVRGVGFKR